MGATHKASVRSLLSWIRWDKVWRAVWIMLNDSQPRIKEELTISLSPVLSLSFGLVLYAIHLANFQCRTV